MNPEKPGAQPSGAPGDARLAERANPCRRCSGRPGFLDRHQAGAFKMAYSPFINRAALRGEAAIARMADDLRTFAANLGTVTEADLELMGWTPNQLATHGAVARRRAYAEAAARRAA